MVGLAVFVARQDYSLALELFFRLVAALFGLFWMSLGILGWRNGKGGLTASQQRLTWCDNMFSLYPRTVELSWGLIESAEVIAALDPYDLNEAGLLLFLRSGAANPRPLAIAPQYLPRPLRDAIGARDPSRVVILSNGEWQWKPDEVREFIAQRIEAARTRDDGSSD